MRATAGDRQRYADYLARAYATEQLNDDELSARLDQALNAKTMGDLSELTDDLNFAALDTAPTTLPVPVGRRTAPVRPSRPTDPVRHRTARIVATVAAAAALLIGGGVGVTAAAQLGPFAHPALAAAPVDDGHYDYDSGFWTLDSLPQIVLKQPTSRVNLSFLQTLTHDTSTTITVPATGSLDIVLPTDTNVVVNYSYSQGQLSFIGSNGVPPSTRCPRIRIPIRGCGWAPKPGRRIPVARR
jgi:hypothetical protein